MSSLRSSTSSRSSFDENADKILQDLSLFTPKQNNDGIEHYSVINKDASSDNVSSEHSSAYAKILSKTSRQLQQNRQQPLMSCQVHKCRESTRMSPQTQPTHSPPPYRSVISDEAAVHSHGYQKQSCSRVTEEPHYHRPKSHSFTNHLYKGDQEIIRSFIKAPPNRTVFDVCFSDDQKSEKSESDTECKS